VELLKQLVLPDGSILRGTLPGRPTRDSLFSDVLRDGTSALKVRARQLLLQAGALAPVSLVLMRQLRGITAGCCLYSGWPAGRP
jgi:hypothetical protein